MKVENQLVTIWNLHKKRIVTFSFASNKEKLLLIKPLKLSIGFYFSITMKIPTLMYFL